MTDTNVMRIFTLQRRVGHAYMQGMAHIAALSHAGRLPVTDGRSADARYLKRVRRALIAQCGGTPSASQRMIIDRIAALSLRVHVLDNDPSAQTGREYLDLTVALAKLLTQLSVQSAAVGSSIMCSPQQCGAAA